MYERTGMTAAMMKASRVEACEKQHSTHLHLGLGEGGQGLGGMVMFACVCAGVCAHLGKG